MKRELPISMAHRLINDGPVVLVTAAYKDRTNVMTAAWTMPISSSPKLIGVALHPGRFTHGLIKQSGEFALNIPGRPLAAKAKLCGSVSGDKVEDKFQLAGLMPAEAKYIGAPIIEECLGHLECRVVDAIELGDHTLFVGEVVAAQVEEDAFDDHWVLEDDQAKPLHHLGGSFYAVLDKRMEIRDADK